MVLLIREIVTFSMIGGIEIGRIRSENTKSGITFF